MKFYEDTIAVADGLIDFILKHVMKYRITVKILTKYNLNM